jgi:hypothetical protein
MMISRSYDRKKLSIIVFTSLWIDAWKNSNACLTKTKIRFNRQTFQRLNTDIDYFNSTNRCYFIKNMSFLFGRIWWLIKTKMSIYLSISQVENLLKRLFSAYYSKENNFQKYPLKEILTYIYFFMMIEQQYLRNDLTTLITFICTYQHTWYVIHTNLESILEHMKKRYAWYCFIQHHFWSN